MQVTTKEITVSGGSYLESLDEKIGINQSLYQLGITAGNDDNFQ